MIDEPTEPVSGNSAHLIRVDTISGSTYEFDTARRAVRRLGNHAGRPPTDRIRANGEWRLLWGLSGISSVDGLRLLIVWQQHQDHFETTLLSAAMDARQLVQLAPLWVDIS